MSTRCLIATAIVLAAFVCAACLPADETSTTTEVNNQPAGSVASLGYSAKLEFRIVHPEDTPMFYTQSTGGEFTIKEDISEPNHERSLQIEGTLSPGDDDGRLLLRYEVQAHHADLNEGFEAVHGASGSALLTPGETVSLTLLGDAPLQVTATRGN